MELPLDMEKEMICDKDEIMNIRALKPKKSIKHREKLESLKAMDEGKLAKVGPPVKSFAMNESFSLGTGSMGTCVYVGIMDDGSEVAIKRMLIQTCKVAAQNEKAILTLIDTKKSPFVVSYRHFFRDTIFMYLIVDLCEETLNDHVHSQSAKHVQEHGRRMIKEILTGLEFLHAQGIVHRDLKPSNVLVDVEGHMRLADFGISRVLNEDETTVQTDAKGTHGWMPSEVIETANQGGKGRYKRKSDVQVAGMIAYFILSKGEHPFGSLYDRMTNILKGNPVNLEKLDDLDARQFVSKLISHKIDDRPHACEALRYLYINEETKCEWASKPCDKKKDGINPDKHCTSGDAKHNFQQSIYQSIYSPDDDENDAFDDVMCDDVMCDHEYNDPDDDDEHYSPADDENDDFDIDIYDPSGDYEGNDPDDDEHHFPGDDEHYSPTDDENDDCDIDIYDPSGDYEGNDPNDDEHHFPVDDEHYSSADDENDHVDNDDIYDPSGDCEGNDPDDDEHHFPGDDEHYSSADNENDHFDDDGNDSFNDDICDPSGDHECNDPDNDEHIPSSDDENYASHDIW